MFRGEEEKAQPNDKNSIENDIHKPYNLLDDRYEREGKKELDARVLYKYPKGKFKFPLIPDEIEKEQKKQKEDVKKEEPSFYEPVQENASEFRRIEKREKGHMFRPTEIPSPIFAFQRSKQEEPVEFELNTFASNKETPIEPILKQQETVKVIQPIPTARGSENESRANIKEEGSIQRQENIKEEGNIQRQENIKEEESIQKEKENTKAESIHKEENKPKETTQFLKEADPTTLIKEDSTKEAQVNMGEPQIAATIETSSERPKKKHVPFNVLMLKQDKKKLEEQKERKKKSNDPLHEQKIVPIENASSEMKESDIKWNLESKHIQEREEAYLYPPLDLLHPPVMIETNKDWLNEQEEILNVTLRNFNVGAKVVNVTQGPSVTRFEVQPEPGVKVNKITNLADDIKLGLAARDIRIEAPIPGKHAIGIEVPNASSRPVLISEIIRTNGFSETASPLAVALGLDISGNPIITDLKKMPHGLIAGATGSGKSVCINTMLVSLIYKAHPDEVKLLLIDPKMVELAPYNHIPHLVSPVITDVKAATASLKWAVEEMERRYELFAHTGVREINRYNEMVNEHGRNEEKLPFIVIVIDELADLMMMSPADVEEAICRIAQKARACGIHLIIATQRPSVDVITGLIKANVPTRIAFSVSSQVDSRTIIDISGAEKLLGRGDMLFLENGSSKPYRLQGTFVSDQEIDDVVAFVRKQRTPEYLFEQDELIKKAQVTEEEDELFYEACAYVIEQGGASTSSLQRRFKVGYNRAARLIDMMEQNGFISEGRGSKPRDVLISAEDLEATYEGSKMY
ncbi:DNA translocase FtsK [Bacillus sp. B15-48]|nr:DNA translocase FtsK [Bacillus sp. B15-48]